MRRKSFNFTRNQLTQLNVYVKLMRAANAVTKKLHAYLSDHGLTTSQFGVLEALYSLGPMHQKEIGAKILKTDGNITMILGNLAKRGLIQRKAKADDRRYQTVRLTRKGQQLMNIIFPIHLTHTEQVFACLGQEELETLGAALKKLGTSQPPEKRDNQRGWQTVKGLQRALTSRPR